MPKFIVTVSRDRAEYTSVEIEASSVRLAEATVRDMYASGRLDDGIEADWNVGDVVPGSDEYEVEVDSFSSSPIISEAKMFLITATNDDGDNLDEFIAAHTPEEAVAHFRNHERENGLNQAVISHIFEVPTSKPSGLVSWTDVPDHATLMPKA